MGGKVWWGDSCSRIPALEIFFYTFLHYYKPQDKFPRTLFSLRGFSCRSFGRLLFVVFWRDDWREGNYGGTEHLFRRLSTGCVSTLSRERYYEFIFRKLVFSSCGNTIVIYTIHSRLIQQFQHGHRMKNHITVVSQSKSSLVVLFFFRFSRFTDSLHVTENRWSGTNDRSRDCVLDVGCVRATPGERTVSHGKCYGSPYKCFN